MTLDTYIEANAVSIDFLRNALDDLSAKAYQTAVTPAFQSSIGAHYRHIIEHYQCFFSQLEAAQTINYDRRERNLRLETDRHYCQQQLLDLSRKISQFDCQALKQTVLVQDDHCDDDSTSSVSRELMFLIGHTEHHSAMIAAMLRLLGYAVDNQFGVASATLNFQRSNSKRA